MGRPKAEMPRDKVVTLRLSAAERDAFETLAHKLGYGTISNYIRHLHDEEAASHLTKKQAAALNKKETYKKSDIRSYHKTDLGEILWGDSKAYLHKTAKPNSVDLIMTSPPFGLVRKKSYGNEDADRYCDWFRPFAEGFKRVLKDDGSLVIDIGGSWIPGKPTRSLYHFKLLVMLVEEFGFHLCQEHYWWNPSKLPTPAEWVNIRRVRVKDAVNSVYWLSKTPYPKANNKRVLQPYSDSMRQLLKTGYRAKKRPSGHNISTKFSKDNGGSVPPNLLAVANTESAGTYQAHCREQNIAIHPARFPSQLPEYFIRFLTDKNDVVLDPFAGSCVTGSVAENLGRKWVCCELSEEYLQGALARFSPHIVPLSRPRASAYEIAPPCSVSVDEELTPLAKDGGASRPASMKKAKTKAVPPKLPASVEVMTGNP